MLVLLLSNGGIDVGSVGEFNEVNYGSGLDGSKFCESWGMASGNA